MTNFSMTMTTPGEAPTVREIVICGAMTIHHAGEIRDAMLEALSEASELRVNMAQVEEIDLVGLQLICSAHRSSVVMNKRFRFDGCRDACLKETIQRAGFMRHAGCIHNVDSCCIWIQGGV